LKIKRDTSTKLKGTAAKMVRRHEGSTKIDMGLKKAMPGTLSSWRQSKKVKTSRKKERPVVIRKYTKAQTKKRTQNFNVFKSKQTHTDKEESRAVEWALKKYNAGCLRAVGRNILVKTLAQSERKRKSTSLSSWTHTITLNSRYLGP